MSEQTPPAEPDVVGRALGLLDHALDLLHDRVLRPIILVGRTVAFSFVLALLSILLVIVLVVGTVRLLDVYAFAGHVYASYLLMGFVLVVAGLVAWRRRHPPRLRK